MLRVFGGLHGGSGQTSGNGYNNSEIYLVKTLQNVRLSNFLTTSQNVRIAADQARYH